MSVSVKAFQFVVFGNRAWTRGIRRVIVEGRVGIAATGGITWCGGGGSDGGGGGGREEESADHGNTRGEMER